MNIKIKGGIKMLSNKQWASKIEKNKGEVKEKIKEAKEMAEKLDKSSD